MHVLPHSVGLIHFVGIGGIGMSGIAEILHSLGYQVQGSDKRFNGNTARLLKRGIRVHLGHDPQYLSDASVVVISSAVEEGNIELAAARDLGLPVVKRADMLAEIMRLKPSIAVGGTHGKTTTTSLLATLLSSAGLDPTVVSGGIINAYGTNARLGEGSWVVAEADESDGTFTRLPATVAIVTNVDAEHLEHYGSYAALKASFRDFVEKIPFYGLGVVCYDHPTVRELYGSLTDRRVLSYGLEFSEVDLKGSHLSFTPEGSTFDITLSPRFKRLCPFAPEPTTIEGLFLPVLGEHNVSNALAAIVTAFELGVSIDQVREGLAHFRGVQRRFTSVGTFKEASIVDDYAHHPTEITAVLKTARQAYSGRVVAVFQPHRFSRLKDLYEDFQKSLLLADTVYVTPVYAAGEDPIEGCDHRAFARDLQAKGQKVVALSSLEDLSSTLQAHEKDLRKEDCILCMGAGDITTWARALSDQGGEQPSGDSKDFPQAGGITEGIKGLLQVGDIKDFSQERCDEL